jgi:hypothetical protein
MDVFKFLKKARQISEEKQPSLAQMQAQKLGLRNIKFGHYIDDRTGERYEVRNGKLEKVLDKEPAADKATEKGPKNFAQMRKDADASAQQSMDLESELADPQGNRRVPGGPDAEALDSGDVKRVAIMRSRGRWEVLDAKQRAQYMKDAEAEILQRRELQQLAADQADAAEAEARAADEMEAQDAAEKEAKKQEKKEKAQNPPITLDQADAIADEDEDDGTGGKLDKLLKDTRAELGLGGGSKPPKPPKKTGGGGSKEPDDKKEPKKQTFGSFKKKADETRESIVFKRNAAAEYNREEVLGPIQIAYDDALQEQSDKIDFANADPEYATKNETKEDIENYALNAILFAMQFERDRQEGAGSKALDYAAIQALRANQERNIDGYGDGTPEMIEQLVNSSRPLKFSPEFIEYSWNLVKHAFVKSGALPKGYEKLHAGLKGSGYKRGPSKKFFYQKDGEAFPRLHEPEPIYRTVGGKKVETKQSKDDRKAYEDYLKAIREPDVGSEVRGGYGSDRAKLMWKLYLEQGGRDAYTGLPMDISDIELEHVKGFQSGTKPPEGPASAKLQRAEERDTDKNYVLISKAVNNSKSELSMEEFYKKRVEPLYSIPKEKFDYSNEKLGEAESTSRDFVMNLLPSFIQDGAIVDGKNMQEFIKVYGDYQQKLDETSDQIKSQYVRVGGAEPIARRKKETEEEFEKRKEEWLDKPENQRYKWAQTKGSAVSTTKGNMARSVISSLGLKHTWARQKTEESEGNRGGNTIGEGTATKFLEAMASDPNISDPKRLQQYKDMYNYALELAKKSKKAGGGVLTDALKDLNYNPDNMVK